MDAVTKSHIVQFLLSHYVMTIGVAKDNLPFVCTAWYVTDDAKILYYKSRTSSNHSQILADNPRVAISIYDHKSVYTAKAGIQATGSVERVRGLPEMAKVVKMYGGSFRGAGEKLTNLADLVSDFTKSTMYKITIEKIKMVDTTKGILITEYEDWL